MNSATIVVAAGGAGRSELASMREDRARSAQGDAMFAPFGAQLAGLMASNIGLTQPSAIGTGSGSGSGAVASQLNQLMRSASADPTLLEGASTAQAREALRTGSGREPASAAQTGIGDRIGSQISEQAPKRGQPSIGDSSESSSQSSHRATGQPGESQPVDSRQPVATHAATGQPAEGSSAGDGQRAQPVVPSMPVAADSVARAVQAAVNSQAARPAAPTQATPAAGPIGGAPVSRGEPAGKPRAAAAHTHAPKQPPMAQLASALAKALKRGDGTVELTLRPSALGQVRVSLAIEGVQVSARFETRAESAQQLLSQSVDQLRAQLAQRGLVLQEVEFVRDEGGHEGDLGRESRSDRPGPAGAARTAHEPEPKSSGHDEIDLTPLLLSIGRVDMLA